MKIEARSPHEYIAKLEEPRRSEIEQLHQLIRKSAPTLEPTMAYGMIGYGEYHYKYASGREGDGVLVALASQKNYISLYVTCAKDGQYLAESYKLKLPNASIGKSCIRFRKLSDIDQNVLKELLKEAEKIGAPNSA